jgi:hypothetical protein
MADSEQVEHALGTVEIVDGNTKAVCFDSLQPMVWMGVERHSQWVDTGFDSGADGGV